MKVLVTGATGFIGANLVRQLLARGDEVHCVIRKKRMAIEGLDLHLHQTPLSDDHAAVEGLARAMDGCEAVYHVAGLFDPSPGGIQRMRAVHIFGLRGLLRAAEKVGIRRMVVCSSSITVGFGPRDSPGDEDTPLDPELVYGSHGTALRAYHDTKVQAEDIAAGWAGVDSVIVNPDYIVGAWDVKPTSGQLIVAMSKGPVPVHPIGGKCFMDADDCALGHILAFERGVSGRRYLLGAHNLSYREFMGMAAKALGKSPPRFPVPDRLMRLAGRVGGILHARDPHRFAGLDPRVLRAMQEERYRSAQRAVDELGVPQTSIEVAVEKAVRWFTDHGYLG
jgi:dihydroflavonol-4-reductase